MRPSRRPSPVLDRAFADSGALGARISAPAQVFNGVAKGACPGCTRWRLTQRLRVGRLHASTPVDCLTEASPRTLSSSFVRHTAAETSLALVPRGATATTTATTTLVAARRSGGGGGAAPAAGFIGATADGRRDALAAASTAGGLGAPRRGSAGGLGAVGARGGLAAAVSTAHADRRQRAVEALEDRDTGWGMGGGGGGGAVDEDGEAGAAAQRRRRRARPRPAAGSTAATEEEKMEAVRKEAVRRYLAGKRAATAAKLQALARVSDGALAGRVWHVVACGLSGWECHRVAEPLLTHSLHS
jgi:hypothetical protein